MKHHPSLLLVAVCGFTSVLAAAQTTLPDQWARDPQQAIDQDYTQRIQKYTTEKTLNSPLTDYLPASKTVPTPMKVLGDVSGAPDMLPYAEDVYRYFRMLAQATPRVRVFTIGHSEEGREMIAVAVADQALLDKAKENDARLAKLADPRTIGLDDAKAAALVGQSYPVYYITGTIHSPETGAPTALIELAYRLAVDNSPYIQFIRSHMITLITPVVEVDGRDRMVDVYRWHKAHPGETYPRLLYWGHYVAHDNNRDAMAMTLNLTNNVLNTYIDWHAQVLHDLHESVPFIYDNTVGDGPYNAWIDPMLADEWAALGWNNVQQMQNFGMPGAFTHGNFDTWSPGYLMFLAGLHNGISRLYETFGNGGADTVKRILTPDEYSRTWYRQNPPYPTVVWSQRDNNNYEETALLSTLAYFSRNTKHFLENFYLKSKRSIEKPTNAGPAAYVLAANDAELNRQIALLQVLKRQHVEINRLTESASIAFEPAHSEQPASGNTENAKTQNFPAGSFVVRMDQPYSRIADALLDRQYWSPDDPQKHPYDDTGWSFGDLFNAKTVRVTDRAILTAKMERVDDPAQTPDPTTGGGPVLAINNTGQTSLASFVFAMKGNDIAVADEAFESDGRHFGAGTLLLSGLNAAKLKPVLEQTDLRAFGISARPSVRTHPAAVPRIAIMHTWLYTQTEGWWRQAFDTLHVPYEYISTQTAARETDLHAKYDVIVFAPVGSIPPQQIVSGMPMWGNPMPWKKTEITPNLGALDQTDDMRPGLGFEGVAHLKHFVEQGGLLITCGDTAELAIESGMAPGVFVAPRKSIKIVGSVLSGVLVAKNDPVAYGYEANLPVFSEDGMAFTVSNLVTNRNILTEKEYKRPTGRGGPADEDAPESRPLEKPEVLPAPKPWQAAPLNEEQARNNAFLIPEAYRPTVILRFGEAKGLLLSGLLEGGDAIAERPAVVEAHLGKGHVLLFATNPIYRGETIGSYALVFNAIVNFQAAAAAGSSSAAAR